MIPKTQQFDFSKIVSYKIKKVQVIQKPENVPIISIHTNNRHAKYQSNIFILGRSITQKTGKGDDVTF